MKLGGDGTDRRTALVVIRSEQEHHQAEREVDQSEAEWTVRQPTARAPSRNDRTVFLRRYQDRLLGQEMLLVVVAEERAEEIVIVTVYKTSKFDRYLRGGD